MSNHRRVARLLRQAAGQVASGTEMYGCHAINWTSVPEDFSYADRNNAEHALYKWLSPGPEGTYGAYGFWGENDRASRVIGLLLAAEIVETEGDATAEWGTQEG